MTAMTPIHAFAANGNRGLTRALPRRRQVEDTVSSADSPISPRLVYPAGVVVSLVAWFALAELGIRAVRLFF